MIKSILAVLCLTATTAHAATFNLLASGTASSPVVDSEIPLGAAFSVNLTFDADDTQLFSSTAAPLSNISGTLNIAGYGTLAFDTVDRTGIGPTGLALGFSGPGFDFPGITQFIVRFSDATSPFGRAQDEFFRSISSDEISQTSLSDATTGFGQTLHLGVTSVSFDEIIAPVPLPTTGAMLVGALGLLGWRARRRARLI